MKPISVYADTSVFGGVFDDKFETESRAFFEQVKTGRFRLVTSEIVQTELEIAPTQVKLFFEELLIYAQMVHVSDQALQLQQAYLRAKIVTPKWESDALHVAVATVEKCSLVISWNFKHIVHFGKIPMYNAVNVIEGYQAVAIHSPAEVISYDE